MLVLCKNCSKKFEKNDAQIKKHPNNFCSRSCSASYNNIGKTRNPRKVKICPICSKEFYGRYKTCSTYCGKILSKKTKKSRDYSTYKKDNGKIETICLQCNKVFFAAKNTQKFCSYQCSCRYNIAINKNKKDAQYIAALLDKNTKTSKADIKNSSSFGENRYVKIRYNAQQVYKYSNSLYVCAHCGYDKHVEICHIKAIKDFDDSALISEINSKENLIALCPNCHWEFDHHLLSPKE